MPVTTPAAPIVRDGAPRVFDLVLFSPKADGIVRRIREEEVGGAVDVQVFAQTAFQFVDGQEPARALAPRQVASGEASRVDPTTNVRQDHRQTSSTRIREFVISATPEMRECEHVDDTELVTQDGAIVKPRGSWCRESYARNALGEAFVRFGGRPSDLALISDADEVPRAAAIQIIKKHYTTALSLPATVLRLGAVHNFIFGLSCETLKYGRAGRRWIKGPIVVTGADLLRYGAQFLRTSSGCVPVGFNAYKSCTRIGRPNETWMANASWHLSSVGGVSTVQRKVAEGFAITNSALARVMAARVEEPLAPSTSLNLSSCLDLWLSMYPKKGTKMALTPWAATSGRLPTYPDVPRVVAADVRRLAYATETAVQQPEAIDK